MDTPVIGLDAAGPAARLWRNVYQKAARAAEARLQALLAEHVYHRHSRRAVAVVLDGGGEVLTSGVACDLELPWAFVLEGWSLYATSSGTLVLDVQKSASFAAFPTDLASICGSAPPFLSAAQKATDADLSEWTTALPRGTVLRVVVGSASGITGATLTLFLRAV